MWCTQGVGGSKDSKGLLVSPCGGCGKSGCLVDDVKVFAFTEESH